MIFIDANIFIAYDNIDDVHHKSAKNIFQNIDEGMYGDPISSDYVFNEVVGVVYRKFGKERALIIGEFLIASVVLLPIHDHMINESWALFKHSPFSLNLVDCSHLIAMKSTKITSIATFDKEFLKIPTIQTIEK